MRLKIISDGTAHGTEIVNIDTGERLDDVTEVTWHCSVGNIAVATIEVACVPVVLIGKSYDVFDNSKLLELPNDEGGHDK